MDHNDYFSVAISTSRVFNEIRAKVDQFLGKISERFNGTIQARPNLHPQLSDGECRLKLFDRQISISLARMVFFDDKGRGEIVAVLCGRKESEPDLELARIYTDKVGNPSESPDAPGWEYPLASDTSVDIFVGKIIEALLVTMNV